MAFVFNFGILFEIKHGINHGHRLMFVIMFVYRGNRIWQTLTCFEYEAHLSHEPIVILDGEVDIVYDTLKMV